MRPNPSRSAAPVAGRKSKRPAQRAGEPPRAGKTENVAARDDGPATGSTTADSILDAAERLFARRGFDGTTVKEIGSEAGVNAALIYYYFVDKRGLHQAVISRFGRELLSRATKALADARSPEDVVRAVVSTQSAMFSGYPERVKIIGRELIDHDAAHAAEFISLLARNVFSRLRDAIAAAQEEGRFSRQYDPAYAALSTISQVIYFHLARPIVQTLLRERGAIGRDEEEAFARHAASFALGALQAGPR
ncbi:MAG TPA: TetR family transcriptional regulator [Gemmatimonadaceae bacterium]|nr:TetR family transcriptional regulator [Gemmatimonadaceae bacterium]